MECETCKYANSCQYFDFCIAQKPEYKTTFENSIFCDRTNKQGYEIKEEELKNYSKLD